MNGAQQTYTVAARTVADGVSRVTARGKDGEIDVDTSAGQGPEWFGPADLLVGAFAACVLKNVERMSRLLSFRYDGASIEVSAVREGQARRLIRVRYTLRLVTDEPEQRVELLHRNVAKYGTIYNTIAAACEIQGAVVVEAPATSAVPVLAR